MILPQHRIVRSSGTAVVMLAIILMVQQRAFPQSFSQIYPDKLITDHTSLVRWNGDTLYACGANSVIIRSTDAGETWTRILESIDGYDFVGMGVNATGIYILPEATYYTASQFLRSDSTFILHHQPRTGEVGRIMVPLVPECHGSMHVVEYRYMQVIDEGQLVLTATVWGMKIPCTRFLFHADVGDIWEELSLPDSVLNRDAVFNFRDRNHGFLLAYYGFEKFSQSLFRTTDGGRQWTECFPSQSGANFICPMQWIDDSTFAIASDDNAINLTSDFGATWTRIPSIPCGIATFTFSDRSTAYLVAKAVQSVPTIEIYKTIDGGQTWTSIYSEGYLKLSNIPQICVLGVDSLVLAGWNGVQLRTLDGGLTWDYQCYETKVKYSAINFVSPDIGFVKAYDFLVGYDTWYRTKNGGRSWSSLRPDDFLRWLELQPVDQSMLWAIYPYSNAPDALIYLSEDGGGNWIPKYIGKGSDSLRILYSRSGHYACGRDSMMVMTNKGILRTLDHGDNWELCPQILNVLSSESLESASLLLYANNTGSQWMQGSDRVLASNDYGSTWRIALVLPDSSINKGSSFKSLCAAGDAISVACREYNTGGLSDHIYQTQDGGGTWTVESTNFDYGQVYMQFVLDNTFTSGEGFALGSGTPNYYSNEWIVYRTTDNWKSSSVAFPLSKIGSGNMCLLHFFDKNNGWLVSTNSIYRTTNGGIDWVRNTITAPRGVTLAPIHPNPVTSGTDAYITYGVSYDKPQAVNIEVYDIMGRRVWEQRRESVLPGEHAVRWETGTVPPGVYVVRLLSGGECSVKKLVVR